MNNKILAIFGVILISLATIGGLTYVRAEKNDNLKKNNIVKIQDLDKDEVRNDDSNIYQEMNDIMKENGFDNATEYMQNGDYNAMTDYMENISQEEYDRMIDIMYENGYDYMGNMMDSIGRDEMIEMHESMHGNGYGGMMGY